MSEAPVSVLIVDDDDLMRAGLRAVLSTDDGILVVGEANNGRTAIELARTLRPDIVLMDVRMPDLDGVAATRELTRAPATTRVVLLTTFEQDDYIFDGLNAGAAGFLLKRTRPEDLITAIHTVADGDSLLSPSVTSRVIARIATQPAQPALLRALALLTPREREVLGLMAHGRSNAEIAADLVLGQATVKSHVKHILQKLDARDRVQAVIIAHEAGVVPDRSPGTRR